MDIENIHKTEKELLQLLKTYACVYLVYAKSPVTLSLDALIKFSPFVMDKKLVVIKMPKIGKDAADFGLAFLAGQLSIQMDKNQTCFDVMSNDGALEYIVDLLRIMGFQASQLKMLSEVKEVEKIKEQPSLVLAPNNLSDSDFTLKLKHLISILSKLKNMPSNEKALLNGVKSWENVTTKVLKSNDIQISMDGKGRWVDNVMVERLWRSVKYEEVYLKAYSNVLDAKKQLNAYFEFYNLKRPHSSLDKMTPDEFYYDQLPQQNKVA